MNRSDFFMLLGYKTQNQRWAWYAYDDDNRKVIFQAWADHYDHDKQRYLIHDVAWRETGSKQGYNDSLIAIDRCLNRGHRAAIMVAHAADKNAIPRKVKSINDKSYVTWSAHLNNG